MPETILGTGQRFTEELTTFANGIMTRCLHLNGSCFSKERGIPATIFTCDHMR